MRLPALFVYYAVHVFLSPHRFFDGSPQRDELLMPMSQLTLDEYRAVSLFFLSDQRRRAFSYLVVLDAFDVTLPVGCIC